MKKLFVLALAVFMVAVFAMPAAAKVESKFGGYFENVWSAYKSLDYQDTGSTDYTSVRLRNRIYYTAVLHENLKVITKFEMDSTWGEQTAGFGDLGADGVQVEVKNAYIDFNLWNSRFEVGTQGFKILRGFVVNDDATGMKVSYRGMDNIIPAFYWYRLYDGDKEATDNGQDVDQYTFLANIKSGNMQFVPTIAYLTSNSGGFYGTLGESMNIYFVGMDFMTKFDMWDLTATGIYEGGEMNDTTDISAYLFNLKVGVKLANFKIRGEFLYSSGEEETATGDYDGFWYPEQSGTGANYSTAEFYRKGWDWTKVPNGPATTSGTAPNGNAVENRMEFGLGVDFNVTKSWKVMLDWWNLNLAEDATNGNTDIGNEIDLKATWQIMKNLKLDLIGAYLIIGDAIEPATNSNDGYEASARLAVSY